jgi:hypothetical protein
MPHKQLRKNGEGTGKRCQELFPSELPEEWAKMKTRGRLSWRSPALQNGALPNTVKACASQLSNCTDNRSATRLSPLKNIATVCVVGLVELIPRMHAMYGAGANGWASRTAETSTGPANLAALAVALATSSNVTGVGAADDGGAE